MAIRYAVATGPWSATATWDGGTLPAANDDVYANTFTVTIDVATLTVAALKRSANTTPAIAAGGGFLITGACALTITAGMTAADNPGGSNGVVTISGSGAVSLSGGTLAPGSSGSRHAIQLDAGFTGTLTVNNNLTTGVGSVYTINALNAAGTIILNGTVTGSTGVALNAAGLGPIITVNGPVTAGTSAAPITITSAGTNAQLTLNGQCTGAAGGVAAVTVLAGIVRVNALMVFAPGFPISLGSVVGLVFGPNAAFRAPSDANWPAASGAPVTAAVATALPTAANVRAGTVFGGGTVGTLAVPPAASVANGVPVDNTVGSAVLKLSDLAAVTGAQIAALGT